MSAHCIPDIFSDEEASDLLLDRHSRVHFPNHEPRFSSCVLRRPSLNEVRSCASIDNRSMHSDSGIDNLSSLVTVSSLLTNSDISDKNVRSQRRAAREHGPGSAHDSDSSASSTADVDHGHTEQLLPEWIKELSLASGVEFDETASFSSKQLAMGSSTVVVFNQELSINNTTVEFVLDEVDAVLRHGVTPPCRDAAFDSCGTNELQSRETPADHYALTRLVCGSTEQAPILQTSAHCEVAHSAHAAGGQNLMRSETIISDYAQQPIAEKRSKKTSRDILKYLDEVERFDRTHKTVLMGLSDDDDENESLSGKPSDLLASATFQNSTKRAKYGKSNALAAGSEKRRKQGTITGVGGDAGVGRGEHSKLVRQLQRELKRQLELTAKFAKDAEHEMKTRLKLQKDDYERDIRRHLAFVDQLIEDKRVLSDKSETLLKEAKLCERKALERIKAMEERHAVEVKRVREMFAASEKVKREKWIDEKTKQIKEATVRSLEHEIQKMIAQHKVELRKQKSMLKAELLEADERASRRFVSEVERVKDEHAREREQLMVSERELARRRVESLEDEWSRRFNDTNARHAQEIVDLVAKYDKQLQDKDEQRTQLEENLKEYQGKELQRLQKHFGFQLEELREQHQLELRRALEQREFECNKRLLEIEQKNESNLLEHLKQAREEMKSDRDREIEAILERLEQESSAAKHDWEQASEQRLKRMADGNQRAMTELEAALRAANDKWCHEKMHVTELESERVRFQVELKERAIELSDIGKIVNRMSTERQNLAQIIRNEFNERLQELEVENRTLKKDVNTSRAQHKFDTERLNDRLEEMTRTHELELNELHERVQATVDRKDRNVEELEEQLRCSAHRADHLEQMLEQQRKHLAQHGNKTDFSGGKSSSTSSHTAHNSSRA